jgi:SAM-dependent methyltransferase
MSAAAEVFQQIYETNYWGFGSGHGSLPKVTKGYRSFIENFIRENQILTVVDVGCGDWQFSRLIDWYKADYLGLDVVPKLIRQNQTRHGRPGIRFELSPEKLSDVPGGGLLLAKDVLQHLPTALVQEFLVEVIPRFRFALITNGVQPAHKLNQEIAIGSWRPLDLRLPPYSCAVPAVFSFSGDAIRSWRNFRKYPSWREVVLLFSNCSTPE